MGKGKKKMPKAVTGGAKEKHKRKQQEALDPKAPPPPSLAIAAGMGKLPAIKSKHHSYFEFVENKNHKKKKLEFKVTSDLEPPPGYEFVPISSTNLTKYCKELSRNRDAMIFIVSESGAGMSHQLSHQLHRSGHHIRENIVEEARRVSDFCDVAFTGNPEPIPDSQEQYTRQVSAAIRNLFPNIPNTDRESLIMHGFNLSDRYTRKVGLNRTIMLHRRVQHAVLAHIRHTHTRYDALLKETGWAHARKIVEPICLDVLVKWRGDEENGQDQLDEILREVVVISDSGSDDSDEGEEDSDETMPDDDAPTRAVPPPQAQSHATTQLEGGPQHINVSANGSKTRNQAAPANGAPQDSSGHRSAARKTQRGFKRYQAWTDAIERNRGEQLQNSSHQGGAVSHGPQQVFGGPTPVVPRNVPQPNGYVAPRAQIGASYPLAAPRPPQQQVNPGPFGQPQHLQDPPRHPSPAVGGLQDMLVQSIEPASPNNVKPPAFVRSLPPRTQLSPVRRSVQYPPAARDGDTRDMPFYVGNNRPTESIAGRMYESPQVHGRSPFPAPLHPPGLSNASHGLPSTYGAPAPAQRVAVGVGHSGGSSRPILMENRGGFYERVHEPSPQMQPPAAYNAPGSRQREGSRMPDRVVSWEEGSSYMREAQNDRDIEIIPVPEPRDWPPTPGAPMQPAANRGPQAPLWDSPQQEPARRRPEPRARRPPPSARMEPIYAPQQPVYGGAAPYQEFGQPVYHQQPGPPGQYGAPPPPGSNIIVLK